MFQDAGLLCDHGVPGCIEATTTRVNVSALKEDWDGEEKLRRDLQVIRSGWYEEGETINTGGKCNLGVSPPPITRKLRSQQKLTMGIEDLVDRYGRSDKVRLIEERRVGRPRFIKWQHNDLCNNPSPKLDNTHWPSNNTQTDTTEDTARQDKETVLSTVEEEQKMKFALCDVDEASYGVKEELIDSDANREASVHSSISKHINFVLYPSEHNLAKCELLNSLNINLMDRAGNGISSFVSECRMNNLLREIVQFKQEHSEELKYSSKNDKAT